jgi:NAD-dependent dihydropyrimidine dehydrogenase PreA subunit
VEEPQKERKRFLIYILLVPLFALGGAVLFRNLSPVLAGLNSNVRLAREIRNEKENAIVAVSKAAIAFKEAGKTENELFEDEINIHERFRKGSLWLGIFLGISFGLSLVSLSTRTRRTGYVPHRGKCYSCGRCFQYCPVHITNKVSNEKA